MNTSETLKIALNGIPFKAIFTCVHFHLCSFISLFHWFQFICGIYIYIYIYIYVIYTSQQFIFLNKHYQTPSLSDSASTLSLIVILLCS